LTAKARIPETQLAYSAPHDMHRAFRQGGDKFTTRVPGDNLDYEDHLHTCRVFVRGVLLFAAHALAVLLLLAWFLM
jgi:hypothetical protein